MSEQPNDGAMGRDFIKCTCLTLSASAVLAQLLLQQLAAAQHVAGTLEGDGLHGVQPDFQQVRCPELC